MGAAVQSTQRMGMMTAEIWTVRRMLQWCTTWLGQRGVESARLDGELLLAAALEVRRLDLFLDPDRPLTPQNLARFRELIAQRGKRQSVAHILGRKGFWTLELAVAPGVLVPRPESERLVEAALALWPDKETPRRVVDVGVGSGALLLALLAEWPNASGFGVDVRQEAVVCARDNSQKLGLAERCAFWRGDLLTAMADTPGWDLVVSNPPYISRAESQSLAPEVAQWEDSRAWFGGEDGLALYRRLIPRVLPLLRPGGWLLLEIGATQGKAVAGLADMAGFETVQVLQDYGRHDRVVAAMRPEET